MSFQYSIIIPTLNEKYFIARNIDRIKSLNLNAEIIVSDGGSTDGTIVRCKKHHVKVVNSVLGRGQQLNAGASAASGEVLIFLHADTFLPENTSELIQQFISNEQNQIARFKLGFDFNNKFLDFYTQFSKYDSQFTRFGDSATIVRREFFKKLNGFDNRGTFEDVDFFKRASKISKIVLLNSSVKSSARKFIKDGAVWSQFFNIFLFIGNIFNVNQKILSKMYNKSANNIKTNSLIIFLRYPQNGKVKTRLAKSTSSEFALNFYKSCVENIIRQVKNIPKINRFAFYSDTEEKDNIINWLGSKLFFSPQEGNDLGGKMKNAFEKVFSTGAEKVIIIGTDVPDLSKEVIQNAFKSLDNSDVVIGPSRDGGYYLLGMKRMNPNLFEGIEYSNNSVYQCTVEKFSKLNLSYYVLPELQDIDTEKDLILWLKSNSINSIKETIKLAYEGI